MADRVIRDEALNSDRLLGLKRNTHRLAFVACVLDADDLGNFEAGPGALWRLWRDWLALTERAQVAEILSALADADLLRLYDVHGKRYAHIPKFRQRLRYINGKHPRPPVNMECKEINDVIAEKTVQGRTKGRLMTDIGQSQDVGSEVKRSEVKRREVTTLAPNAIAFDAAAGWTGVSDADRSMWAKAYPAIDIPSQLAAAAAWARANPKNAKSNWRRFLTNWLARSQERAPRAGGGPQAARRVAL